MDKFTSLLLFLLCCIPLRILIATAPLYVSKALMPYLGVLLLAISVSFFTLYFGNLRLDAPEGGGVTWWSDYRLLHGSLYFTGAIYAFQGKTIAWIPLAFDVLLGIGLFANKRLL